MNKAVFLDRDGVICKEKSYITHSDKMELFDYSQESIKALHGMGYKCIIITNQSAVARGLILEKDLIIIHNKLKDILNVDDIYYCPHYFDRNRSKSKYNVKCNCRKPNPGMLLEAGLKHNIDLKKSYMVGDRTSDILAGKNAGVKTVLVKSGYIEKIEKEDEYPDYIFNDLKEFVEYLKIQDRGVEL